MEYELIIVGAGPAGLTAAVYAARYKINTLVIGGEMGGLAAEAIEIQNFPTYSKITGMEFVRKMEEQVKNLGVEIKTGFVESVEKSGSSFLVKTDSGEYRAKKIILTSGSMKRKLGLENEDKLLGKGISYCAICDATFYKDKTVGVVGGSNSALTAALLISKYAEKVYIIYRKDKFFRADPAWEEEIEKNKKIEKIFNANVVGIKGENKLESIKLDNGKEIKLDGLFVEIGYQPNLKMIGKLSIEMEGDFIKVDRKQKTNINGFFAAGDLTNYPLKQIIVACAQGAIAANSVYEELRAK